MRELDLIRDIENGKLYKHLPWRRWLLRVLLIITFPLFLVYVGVWIAICLGFRTPLGMGIPLLQFDNYWNYKYTFK